MKMKKLLAMILAAAMILCLTACTGTAGNTGSGNDDSASGEREVLRVGTMALTMGVPVLYAEEMGYFEEAGLNVSIELFATGAPINEAIAANQIDVAVSGFASVYSLANANCTWLADVNTTGGMGLFVRSDSDAAKNPCADTLKGFKVLEPLGTAVQYMTESYAAQFGLQPDEIEQVNMEYASAYQAFTTGEGDAMAANPPYSYQLMDEGYIQLCTFEEATGVNMCDGCFARNEVVESRSEEIQLFINCLVKAMDALQDPALRAEYTRKVYDTNAISCTDEALAHEIEDRAYVGTDAMKASGYKLGAAWVAITDFLVSAEKITAENAPNVPKSINTFFVSAAVGSTIEAG